ncbi:MAG TPA: lysylphosphatidylglycerol synthase transmembrane domain-containing protein [Bacteroidales bacterium]|nr:lysylphosphatidylglycerol synthase transmembrane domain-containing protein [Bacteroidales bacterium]
MNNKIKNVARFMLFLGIGIFFIWLFLHNLTSQQKKEILLSFGDANYWIIGFAILLGLVSHYTRAIRWKMLLKPMGYETGNRNTFFAVMIGYIANLALPRLGEVSRCTILSRYENVPFNKSFGTVVTERGIDLLVFLILFFVNLALQFDKLYSYIDQKIYQPLEAKFHLSFSLAGSFTNILLLALVVLAILFFVFRKKLLKIKLINKLWNIARGFLEGMKSIIHMEKPWLFVLYSVIIWGLYWLMAYLVYFSLPETSHLGPDAGLATLVFGTIGIMLVQGGIGIYPAIVAETLILYGVASTKGYALGWLIWSSQTLTIIILGVLSFILLPIYNKKKSYEKAGVN